MREQVTEECAKSGLSHCRTEILLLHTSFTCCCELITTSPNDNNRIDILERIPPFTYISKAIYVLQRGWNEHHRGTNCQTIETFLLVSYSDEGMVNAFSIEKKKKEIR